MSSLSSWGSLSISLNLVMVLSDKSIGTAQGLIAPILNWPYMIINPIIMTALVLFLMNFNYDLLGLSVVELTVLSSALNVPGLALLFNQLNALLFIYEANEGKDLITDVIFA